MTVKETELFFLSSIFFRKVHDSSGLGCHGVHGLFSLDLKRSAGPSAVFLYCKREACLCLKMLQIFRHLGCACWDLSAPLWWFFGAELCDDTSELLGHQKCHAADLQPVRHQLACQVVQTTQVMPARRPRNFSGIAKLFSSLSNSVLQGMAILAMSSTMDSTTPQKPTQLPPRERQPPLKQQRRPRPRPRSHRLQRQPQLRQERRPPRPWLQSPQRNSLWLWL